MQACRPPIWPLIVTITAATACASAPSPSAQTPATSPSDTPRIVQPGAPGQPTRVITAEELAQVAGLAYTEVDVHFMQSMVPHHAQALEMTELVRRHAKSSSVRRLALRMEISQRDEIDLIEGWLKGHGEAVRLQPEAGGAMSLMPGMLTPEQMQRLASARGDDFDRLFLELMIQHHQGAIVMVQDLFKSSGAAQESTIFQFASNVDSDQAMEIARMRRLLRDGNR